MGYRVVLLGGAAVGKTALATQMACGCLPAQREPSVDEVFGKAIEVEVAPALPDSVSTEYQVALKGVCIRNSNGFVVLHGVCSAASFQVLRLLRERVGRLRGPKALPLVLLGTKAGLDVERQVLAARGPRSGEWCCLFLEVTAKSKLMWTRCSHRWCWRWRPQPRPRRGSGLSPRMPRIVAVREIHRLIATVPF